MLPGKFHSVCEGLIRISGWKTGIHKPPPMGSAWFLVASTKNMSFNWATLSGISPARSWACDQSSSMLYNSQVSSSGDHCRIAGSTPLTHGKRGPIADAIQPSW